MEIISGVPLFAGQATNPVVKVKSPNVLFNSQSITGTSHVVEVMQNAIVVRAFGLTGDKVITVSMLDNDGVTTVGSLLKLNGKTVQLDSNNTCLMIDLPGKYTFGLSGTGAVGTVSAVFWVTGMAYWSYGLAAFAAAS